MPTAGLREQKKTSTRTALVDCALRLAEERGYDGFTIADLVETVGVSRRTFSNYFQSKAECVTAASDPWMESALDMVDAAAEDVPIADLLRDILENLAEQVADSPISYLVLLHSEPELIAAASAREVVHHHRISSAVAARTGLPAEDVRVSLLADFALAAGRICIERWLLGGRASGKAGLMRDFDLAFSLVDFGRLVCAPPKR
jgi:AcrR family transcriptional regulator